MSYLCVDRLSAGGRRARRARPGPLAASDILVVFGNLYQVKYTGYTVLDEIYSGTNVCITYTFSTFFIVTNVFRCISYFLYHNCLKAVNKAGKLHIQRCKTLTNQPN